MDDRVLPNFIITLCLCLILCVSFFATIAHGQEHYEFYQGVRQLGMGGAGIGTVNDETSLLINPAGLGKLRDYIVTVVDPEISLGQNTSGIIAKGKPLGFLNPQDLLDAANKKKGQHFNTKAQMFPSIIFPNFGFGLLAKYEINGAVDKTGTTFDYSYRNDVAAVMGYNLRFWDGIIKLGMVSRYINRVEAVTSLPATSTGLNLKSLATQGTALAADTGLVLTAPISTLPSLSVVVRDIGHTKFNLGGGIFSGYQQSPRNVLQSADVAVSFFPIFSNHIRSSFSVEGRDVLNFSKEKDQMKRVHTGFEVNFYDSLFLRAGMNQRYWTFGAEIATQYYQFQVATYGEEIGIYPSYKEDRRYVTKFVFRF